MKQIANVPVHVRGQVAYFAGLMERKLTENDHKGGWRETHPLWLLSKLTEEIGELGQLMTELYHPHDARGYDEATSERLVAAIWEAVDVANVAMMVVDVLSERAVEYGRKLPEHEEDLKP